MLDVIDEVTLAGDVVYRFVPGDGSASWEQLGNLFFESVDSLPSDPIALPLAWGAPPHNVASIERLQDMDSFANDVTIYGGAATARPRSGVGDLASQAAYGTYEAGDVYPDLTLQSYIDGLADAELVTRARPKEIVSWTPQIDQRNEATLLAPFDDFNLGTLFNVSAGPRLRGGFEGVQRCWGFDLDIDDDAIERVSAIYTGPDS